MRQGLLVVLTACLLGSAFASADVPLDITNPTPRPVQLQLDENFFDFASVGQDFGPPVTGQWVSDGTTGLITVPGPDIEALVDSFGLVSVVYGTFSDYSIVIDIASGHVTSANITGQVVLPVIGPVAFIQTAASLPGIVAGFVLGELFGLEYPMFCDSGPSCTLVPGQPYDPGTGKVNAVGTLVAALTMFTPFGDMRFTEAPSEPYCEIEATQGVYVDGEVSGLGRLRLVNPGGFDLPVRLLLELQYPLLEFSAAFLDRGATGDFLLPAGLDVDLGVIPIYPITPAVTRGDWLWRCALEDPASGDLLAEDVTEFHVQ